jgi:hypothetical protein
MSDEVRNQANEYKPPQLPAYTAVSLHYWYFWAVPYWITEFILFCIKGRVLEDGVSDGDWVILFLWLIAEVFGCYMSIRSIQKIDFGAILLFVLCAFARAFFTIYIFKICSTILFIELVTSVITLIGQILLILSTAISIFLSNRGLGIRPAD